MDPFGDSNGNDTDLSSFQAPADASAYANDFYEVDSGEATATDAFGYTTETTTTTTEQDFNASYGETTTFQQETYTTYSENVVQSGSRTSSFGQFGAQIPVIEEENELTKFMREYEQKIAEKAVEQEKVAVESKEKAKQDMEKFAAERSRIKESKQQANRVHEQATLEKLAADLESENPWERVVSLVELEANRKQKLAALNAKKDAKNKETEAPKAAKKDEEEEDVSRMRQLFVQLKAEPLDKTRAIASH
ncbi:Clathrin light chain, partial [Globisporangium splendens]